MTATTFDSAEFARFVDRLRALGIEPSTVPARPGSKIPAVKWGEMSPGENGPHWPHTEARLLLTGSRSGGICVIDIDTKDGGFGNFEAWERANPPRLPPLFSVRSPSGGLHLYYRPARIWRTVQGQPVQGVDIRGEGGVVVVPGSLHPRGGIYRIEEP